MKAKCPQCPAEADLGPEDVSNADTSYKLKCPVIDKALAEKGGFATDMICTAMRDKIAAEIKKNMRHRQASSGGPHES
jgi:hypothetical protein